MSDDELRFNEKTGGLEYHRPTYGGWRAGVGWLMLALPTLAFLALIAYMVVVFVQFQWGVNLLDLVPALHR